MQKDLEADGLEVETATDGVHALEVLEKTTCDIALVDIEMPRMNGYELLQHLRQDPRYAGLPIIIVTSRSGEQHRQRAMELGADGYITKPYDIGQLDRMMREAIASRHALH
jgi:chemosensory pili system protein ChpA (sensor histidine kinase/response regulator)